MRHRNRGTSPRDKSVKLGVQWANGVESKHNFTSDQLRWTLTGSPFDIAWFWRA